MKQLARRRSRRDESASDMPPPLRKPAEVIGHIPGLERLLPGHYRPGSTVQSRYGTWILPLCFKGRPLCAIIDGVMIG